MAKNIRFPVRTCGTVLSACLLLAVHAVQAADVHLVDPPAAPVAEAGVAKTAPGRLIPFEQAGDQMVLSGEDDRLSLSFALGEAEAKAGGTLKIGYTNAVSVLPETARLAISVNGKPSGIVPVRSPNGVTVEAIPLAAKDLVAGRNRVELRVVEHHRVDCSLDATYELWTKIIAAQSGFAAADDRGFSKPMDLLTVAKSEAGFTDLHLVAPLGSDPARINDALPALQSLALALNRKDVRVSISGEHGTGPGIDLVLGSGGPTGFTVGNGEVAGRALVTISGSSAEARARVLADALTGPLKPALASGILAGEPGRISAEAGRRFTLADTGYVSQPFAGRLSRTRFLMDMPADFYPADYDTMTFSLNGATAGGLAAGAQFLIRVNDRVVTSYPFRNENGETFRNQHIQLPLRAFRPGVNRVELLAELPGAADAACAPEQRQDVKPRFVLLQDSALEVPALARMSRLPDLGAFAGAAYPYASGKPYTVLADQPDAATVSAALTTVVKLALAAEKPLDAHFAYGKPDATMKGDVLAVSTAGSDDAAAAEVSVIDPQVTGATGHADAAISLGSQQLLEAFRADTRASDGGSLGQRMTAWFASTSTRLNSWLRYQDAEETALPPIRNRLITLGQRPAPDGQSVWTEIEAASPKALDDGFSLLAQPEQWQRLQGGTAVIAADTRGLVTHAAEHRFIRGMPDASFGNMRRLISSWFSDNFEIYVLLVALFIGAFAYWAGTSVENSSARKKP